VINLHDIETTPIGPVMWVTKEGIEVPFVELDMRHLENILRKFVLVYNYNSDMGRRVLGARQEWIRRRGWQ